MTKPMDELLAFTAFTHEIRNVKRAMLVQGQDQFENDSEHSYQLALIALYIIEHDQLAIDPYRAMALALVHDILEVHAGDTFIYGRDTGTQKEREKQAVARLKQEWPGQQLLLSLIDEYEAHTTQESKFVYALDKLVPILNNILDQGRSWRREHITLDQVIAAKTEKISVDPDVRAYFNMALEVLRERPEMFVAAQHS